MKMPKNKLYVIVLFTFLDILTLSISSSSVEVKHENVTLEGSGESLIEESDKDYMHVPTNISFPNNGNKSINVSGSLIEKPTLNDDLISNASLVTEIKPTPTLNSNLVIVTATQINASNYFNTDISLPDNTTNHTLIFPVSIQNLDNNSSTITKLIDKEDSISEENISSVSLENSSEVKNVSVTPEYEIENSLPKYTVADESPSTEPTFSVEFVPANQSSSEGLLDDNYLSSVFALSSFERNTGNTTNPPELITFPSDIKFNRPNPFDIYQDEEEEKSSVEQEISTTTIKPESEENYKSELSWNEMIAPLINPTQPPDKRNDKLNLNFEDLPSPSPLQGLIDEKEQPGLEDEFAEAFFTREMGAAGSYRRRRPGPGTRRKVRMKVRKLSNTTSDYISEQPQYLKATETEKLSDYDIEIKKISTSRPRKFRSTTTTTAPPSMFTSFPEINTAEAPGLADRLNELIMRNPPNSILKIDNDLFPERQIEKPGNAFVDSISTYHPPPRTVTTTTTSRPTISRGPDEILQSLNKSQNTNEWLHSSTSKHHDYPHPEGQFLLSRHKWEKNYMNLQQNSFYGASPEDLERKNNNIGQTLVALNRPETKDRNQLTFHGNEPIRSEEPSIIIINDDSGDHQTFRQDDPDFGLRDNGPKEFSSDQPKNNLENLIHSITETNNANESPETKLYYNPGDNQASKEFISIHALQTTERHPPPLPDSLPNPTIEVIPINLNDGDQNLNPYNPFNTPHSSIWENSPAPNQGKEPEYPKSHYDRTRQRVTELTNGFHSTEVMSDPTNYNKNPPILNSVPHAEILDYPLDIPNKKPKNEQQVVNQRGLKQPEQIPIQPFQSHEFLGFGSGKHLDPEKLNNDLIPGVRKKATKKFHGTRAFSNQINERDLPLSKGVNNQTPSSTINHSPRIPEDFFNEMGKISSQFPSRPIVENPTNGNKNGQQRESNAPFSRFSNPPPHQNGPLPSNIADSVPKNYDYYNNEMSEIQSFGSNVHNSPGFIPDRGPLLDDSFPQNNPQQSYHYPNSNQNSNPQNSYQYPDNNQNSNPQNSYQYPKSNQNSNPRKNSEFSKENDQVQPTPKITLPMPGLVNIPTPPPESHALNEIYSHRHYPPHTHSISSKPDYEPANPPLQKGHPLEYHFDPFIQNAGDFKGDKVKPNNEGKPRRGGENSVRDNLHQYQESPQHPSPLPHRPSKKHNSNFEPAPEFSVPPHKKRPKKKVKNYFPSLFRGKSNRRPIPPRETEENISYYYSKESSPEISHNPSYYYNSEGPPPPSKNPSDPGNGPVYSQTTSQEYSIKGFSRTPLGPGPEQSEMFSDSAYVLMFPKMVPETAMMPKRPHINGKKIPVISASDPIRAEMEAPGYYPIRASPREQMLQVLASNHYNLEMKKYMEKKRRPPLPIYTPYGMLVPMGPEIPPKHSPGSFNNQNFHTSFHKTGPLENFDGVNNGKNHAGDVTESNIDPALELLADKLAAKLSYYDDAVDHIQPYSEAQDYQNYNRETSYSEHRPVRTKPKERSNRMEKINNKISKSPHQRQMSKSYLPDRNIKKALKTLIKERLYEMLEEASETDNNSKQDKSVNFKKPHKHQDRDREAAFLPMNMIVESSNAKPIIQEPFVPFGAGNMYQTTPVPPEPSGGILQSIKRFFFGKEKKIPSTKEQKPYGVWMKGPPVNPYLNKTGEFPKPYMYTQKIGTGTSSLVKKEGIPMESTLPLTNSNDEEQNENNDQNTNDRERKPVTEEQSIKKTDMERILQLLYKAAKKPDSESMYSKNNKDNELTNRESTESLDDQGSEESESLDFSQKTSTNNNPTSMLSFDEAETLLHTQKRNQAKRKNNLTITNNVPDEAQLNYSTKKKQQVNSYSKVRNTPSKSSDISDSILEYENLYKPINQTFPLY